MTTTTTITVHACKGDRVGDIQCHGCYGGAFATHWQIERISGGIATLSRVVARSFRSPDGTYNHEWVPALPTD